MFPFDTPIVTGTDTFDSRGEDGPLDLLGRKAFGKRLSDLMGRGDQPLVVALDGGWGAGKSHFLKLWTGSHQGFGGKARVVYFDAFERDYLDDPLISLVAAISSNNEASQGKIAKALDTLKAWGIRLARPAARVVVNVVTNGLSEIAAPVADKVLEEVNKGAQAAIDTLWQREEGRIAAVEGFRSALQELAAEQPLILVIDELDRCRPDYALSLLEVVKHFFSVPGVRFVLGVNLQALAHSVQQRYGAGVDGVLYLQKFVHLTVGLPGHDARRFHPHWKEHFRQVSARVGILSSIFSMTERLLDCIAEQREITLRDVQRLCSRLALLPRSIDTDSEIIRFLAISAIILETLAHGLYRKFRSEVLTLAEVSSFFSFTKQVAGADGASSGPSLKATDLRIWTAVLENGYIRSDDFPGLFGGQTEMQMPVQDIYAQLREILDTFAPPPAR